MGYNESLNSNSNYPIMSNSEWDNAPWNQVDNPEREIEVTVSITLSKTIKIRVNDYKVIDCGKDEDGIPFEDIDYTNCNLEAAVKEQYILPHIAYKYVTDYSYKVVDMLKGWCVDDFEVVNDSK